MKRLLLIGFTLCLFSCGSINQSPLLSTSQQSVGKASQIQSSFFDSRFGETAHKIYFEGRSTLLSYGHGRAPKNYLAPLGNRKIKNEMRQPGASFGSYRWDEAVYLIDFNDLFFGIAFIKSSTDLDELYTRYSDIKNTLDQKYGHGEVKDEGVFYSDKDGRLVVLSVVESEQHGTWFCGLYYLDDKLYQKDTSNAINEL